MGADGGGDVPPLAAGPLGDYYDDVDVLRVVFLDTAVLMTAAKPPCLLALVLWTQGSVGGAGR